MSVLARWTIKPRLLGVPGVANVAIWGQRDRQIQVQVDPEQLQPIGVSLLDVIETTGNALVGLAADASWKRRRPAPAGSSTPRTSGSRSSTCSPIKTADDLAQVPVEIGNGDDARQ